MGAAFGLHAFAVQANGLTHRSQLACLVVCFDPTTTAAHDALQRAHAQERGEEDDSLETFLAAGLELKEVCGAKTTGRACAPGIAPFLCLALSRPDQHNPWTRFAAARSLAVVVLSCPRISHTEQGVGFV